MTPRAHLIIRQIHAKLSELEAGKAWRADIVGDVRGRLNVLSAELETEPPAVATLEVREAPDLAKELIAWLDNNVMRCPHGTIGVTCHICTTEHLSRWLPR